MYKSLCVVGYVGMEYVFLQDVCICCLCVCVFTDSLHVHGYLCV